MGQSLDPDKGWIWIMAVWDLTVLCLVYFIFLSFRFFFFYVNMFPRQRTSECPDNERFIQVCVLAADPGASY